ncbi:unnamed protein product [Nezara viridula]|uniref:Uncharacterized protein n=1 Tax=Nezara viridula TaxID=85310 RepID=A0A9P0E8C7_NEZVI|nr:unnamed protein product [Nezara viridula]
MRFQLRWPNAANGSVSQPRSFFPSLPSGRMCSWMFVLRYHGVGLVSKSNNNVAQEPVRVSVPIPYRQL